MDKFSKVDFYGILTLDRSLVEKLRIFLNERESELCESLLGVMPIAGNPHLKSPSMRYSQTLDILSNRIKSLREEEVAGSHWQEVVSKVNITLWRYVELLESIVLELFQQLKQMGMDKWSKDLFHTVEALNELIYHRIDDLIWTFYKLEELMSQYRALCEGTKNSWLIFGKLWGYFFSLLDRQILSNLLSSQKYLKLHFNHFKSRFSSYQAMLMNVDDQEKKFRDYPVFTSLEKESQDHFMTFYRVIKIWEENSKKAVITRQELSRTIRQFTPPGKALQLFKNYLRIIKEWLFKLSEEWKETKDPSLINKILIFKTELITLGAVIGQFRDMVLATDPNPYVRSRLGFTEWIVGPEPRKTKEFLELLYEAEKINGFYRHLEKAIEAPPLENIESKRRRLEKEIDEVLREISQPLASRSLIYNRVDRFFELMEACDELGGSLGDMTHFISKTLIRALRYDWKYQVLPEHSKFNSLIFIHFGFIKKENDPTHERKLHRFKRMIYDIENWIRHKDAYKHLQEIETDINDCKEAFQEILMLVKKQLDNVDDNYLNFKKVRNKITAQLLDYQVLFSKFFYFIHNHESDGKLVRNQFLFVDQYFEAIEEMLQQVSYQFKKNNL